MNFISRIAETLQDVPNVGCVIIIFLVLFLICLVVFTAVMIFLYLKDSFERYIEKLVSSTLREKYGDIVTKFDERIVKEIYQHYAPKKNKGVKTK